MEEMQKKRAVEHDQWFRQQVTSAVEEADKPGVVFIPHTQVRGRWAAKRKELTHCAFGQRNSDHDVSG